jgi:hypothetical protein
MLGRRTGGVSSSLGSNFCSGSLKFFQITLLLFPRQKLTQHPFFLRGTLEGGRKYKRLLDKTVWE